MDAFLIMSADNRSNTSNNFFFRTTTRYFISNVSPIERTCGWQWEWEWKSGGRRRIYIAPAIHCPKPEITLVLVHHPQRAVAYRLIAAHCCLSPENSSLSLSLSRLYLYWYEENISVSLSGIFRPRQYKYRWIMSADNAAHNATTGYLFQKKYRRLKRTRRKGTGWDKEHDREM